MCGGLAFNLSSDVMLRGEAASFVSTIVNCVTGFPAFYGEKKFYSENYRPDYGSRRVEFNGSDFLIPFRYLFLTTIVVVVIW